MKYCLSFALIPSLALFALWSSSASEVFSNYPHENEEITGARQVYDGDMLPDIQVNTFRNIHRLFPVRLVKASGQPSELSISKATLNDFSFSSNDRKWDLPSYFESNHVGGMLVIKNSEIVFEKYLLGNTRETKWLSMSVVKSMLATLVGVAIKDGSINSIDDSVTKYLPELVGTAYDTVTIRQLLQMTSGVAWNETYTDPSSDRRAMLEAQISQKPNSIISLMGKLKRVTEPGTRWNYSTGETQVVAALLRNAVDKPLANYLSDKIWQPYGMEADGSWWLDSPQGTEIGGSGLSATLRDYARFGLYILDNGKINDTETLPAGWVQQITDARNANGKIPEYAYMWWPTKDEAFSAIGIFGQYIYVHPKSKTVIALWSAQPKPEGTELIDNLSVFKEIVDYLE